MRRRLKLVLVSLAAAVLLLAAGIAVAAALFLRQFEFKAMEPLRVLQAAGPSAPASTPLHAVRVAAEWEPALGALVHWPLMVPEALVTEIAEEDTLFVLVEDEGRRAEAEKSFTEWGMDLGHVEFILTEPGGAHPWTRDWGPFARFDENDEYSLADPWFDDYPLSGPSCDGRLYSQEDWTFTDFTPDDRATQVLAAALDFPSVQLPVALTGGNVMLDGHGTAFSACAMLNENRLLGIGEEQFLDTVREQLGISSYVVIPNFELFGIQHIDCFLKLLDEETILVARPPQGHSHSERAEAIVKELTSLLNVYGRPYRILRIDTPPYWLDFMPAYTNSLILNKKILVPLYGIPADQDALKTWREAMPGYEVIGFEHHGSLSERWMWFDALHCRTRAIWDPEMLYMTHRRIDERVPPADAYPVEVRIRDYSGAGLILDSLSLSWRRKGEDNWQAVSLEAGPDLETFVASIPAIAGGQTVEYFFSAADGSGRRESLPRTAPDGTYSFRVVRER